MFFKIKLLYVEKFLRKVKETPTEKRAELGKQGRAWAINKFSVEVVGKQWEDLIDSLPDHIKAMHERATDSLKDLEGTDAGQLEAIEAQKAVSKFHEEFEGEMEKRRTIEAEGSAI